MSDRSDYQAGNGNVCLKFCEECHGPLTFLEVYPPDYTGVKLCPDTVLWCPTCVGEEAGDE